MHCTKIARSVASMWESRIEERIALAKWQRRALQRVRVRSRFFPWIFRSRAISGSVESKGSQTFHFLRCQPRRQAYKARIMEGKDGNLRANMYIYKTVDEENKKDGNYVRGGTSQLGCVYGAIFCF